ncbi:39907_t:CDS:2 [Gigaspora margarita]|uniref:39907_t:CDS:1 n=1 Tax=Gigaspora margarita TaxID=4874 RepID=A0ABN7V206_GIGMA|nr:39907_t:CDS:2 [Gigaspora margarita]
MKNKNSEINKADRKIRDSVVINKKERQSVELSKTLEPHVNTWKLKARIPEIKADKVQILLRRKKTSMKLEKQDDGADLKKLLNLCCQKQCTIKVNAQEVLK